MKIISKNDKLCSYDTSVHHLGVRSNWYKTLRMFVVDKIARMNSVTDVIKLYTASFTKF